LNLNFNNITEGSSPCIRWRGLQIMGGRKIFSEKSGRIVRFLKFYPLSTKMTLWC